MPLVGAALLSQSFPLINDYQRVGDLGNFVDGGLFENHGLVALHGIYRQLHELDSNLHIKIIFITNNDINDPDSTYDLSSQVGLDADLVGNGHNISGNNRLWSAILEAEAARNHEPLNADNYLILQRSYDTKQSKSDHLPLAKWISKHSVQMAEKRAASDSIQLQINHLMTPSFKK